VTGVFKAVCFWCGEDTGITMPKENYDIKTDGDEAILSYVPCAGCQTKMNAGITLFEVTAQPETPRPEIMPGFFPTGYLFVVDEAAFIAAIKHDHVDTVLAQRYAFVPTEVIEMLGLRKKKEENDG